MNERDEKRLRNLETATGKFFAERKNGLFLVQVPLVNVIRAILDHLGMEIRVEYQDPQKTFLIEKKK